MVMGDVSAVLVLVVVVIVVVVVGRARHPVAVQASQQLEKRPTQPPLARHVAAFFLILQRVEPFRVRQHVTAPRLPHTDFAAQRLTLRVQLFESSPDATRRRATPTAHAT